MLYAAFTFWLLVIVFCAWGVHAQWTRLIKPRVFNALLLPGTLISQLGQVLGLLITGNSVHNATLMGDDDKGDPQIDPPDQLRPAVVGPILVGLLPLAACALALYFAAQWFGRGLIKQLVLRGDLIAPQTVPMSLDACFDLLRRCVSIVQVLVDGILHSKLLEWQTPLFLYLAICLTVRMTPLPGNRRGALGAIVLAGVLTALLGLVITSVRDGVLSVWPLLSFAAAMLMLLLLLSLLTAGVVGLVRIFARKG